MDEIGRDELRWIVEWLRQAGVSDETPEGKRLNGSTFQATNGEQCRLCAEFVDGSLFDRIVF